MLNYRHLHYFWVVTKEGGFARAAERLDMAVQTISAQVRELEKSLGHQLLKPSGRGVALTEAGHAAFARAEEIFQLGQGIPEEVRAVASGLRSLRRGQRRRGATSSLRVLPGRAASRVATGALARCRSRRTSRRHRCRRHV